MKKMGLIIIGLLLCLIITVPCMAGEDERDILADEPDSTYLDSLKKARIRDQQESFEHFYEVKREEVIPHLSDYIESLSDTMSARRESAVSNLGLSQVQSVIPYIEQLLLEDPVGNVREQCARSLGLLKSYNSQPHLIEALNDSVKKVRLHSALTLASLGDTTYCMPVLEKLWETEGLKTRHIIIKGFADVGTEKAIQILQNALKDEVPRIAVSAAIRLSELGYGEYAFPVLENFLKHSDKHIRSSAIRGLAEIGNAASLRLIKSMLNNESPFVRQYTRTLLQSYFNIEVPKN